MAAHYRLTQVTRADDFTTPKEAWADILPFVPDGAIIWESAFCDGKSKDLWRELIKEQKRKVRITHKNRDFFEYEPKKYTHQITNPPYSKKKEWLERSIALGIPFAILVPLETIATRYFQKLL